MWVLVTTASHVNEDRAPDWRTADGLLRSSDRDVAEAVTRAEVACGLKQSSSVRSVAMAEHRMPAFAAVEASEPGQRHDRYASGARAPRTMPIPGWATSYPPSVPPANFNRNPNGTASVSRLPTPSLRR
jgi:hypothetical protein